MAKKTESTFVDWDELDGKLTTEVNPEDDAFERNPPPQPGIYKVKLGWQDKEEGVVEKVLDEDEKLIGYKLYASVTILQGDAKGTVLPIWLRTVQLKNKKTSQVASLLVKLKVELSGKQSHKNLVLKLRDLINKGKVCWVKVGWRGTVQIDNEWVTLINNESGFEKREDGSYVSRAEKKHKGQWYQVDAQANVEKFYAENPDVAEDDEEEEEEEKVEVKKAGKKKLEVQIQSKKKKMVVEEEEEDEDEDEDEDEEDED